jgi:hypothetical protein
MPCPRCRQIVDARERLCPHCGIDTDAKLAPARIVLSFGAIGLLLIMATATHRLARSTVVALGVGLVIVAGFRWRRSVH